MCDSDMGRVTHVLRTRAEIVTTYEIILGEEAKTLALA